MGSSATEDTPYFLGIEGNQSGPYSAAELQEKIRMGYVPKDAVVWCERMSGWEMVVTLPEFRATFISVKNGPAPRSQEREDRTTVAQEITRHAQHLQDEMIAVATEITDENEVLDHERGEEGGGDHTEVGEQDTPSNEAKEFTQESTYSDEREAPERREVGEETEAPRARESQSDNGEEPEPQLNEVPNEPVFGQKEAAFSDPLFLRNRMKIMVGGIFLLIGAAIATFVWRSQTTVPPEDPATRLVKPVPPKKTREEELSKALSELKIKSTESLATLSKLIAAKPDDKVAEEAVRATVDHFRLMRQPLDAGKILLAAKKPLEAVEYFMVEPPAYDQAELSLFQAYELEKDPQKKFELLVRNIDILLTPLNNNALALERIKILPVHFPGKTHPYGYYLKTSDEKIADLFARLSHFFVETLISHIDQQLPQIRMVARPGVKLTRDGQIRHRIVGSYQGEIDLSQDRLTGIFLTFWLWNDQWVLVDTNLTPERKKWAGAARKKHDSNTLSTAATLQYLETLFRTQFPKIALHESLSADNLKIRKPAESDD